MAVLTPIKAIRAKCIDCCGGQKAEVRLCPCEDCSLHPYRMGHRPKPADPQEFSLDDIEDIDLNELLSGVTLDLDDLELPKIDIEEMGIDIDAVDIDIDAVNIDIDKLDFEIDAVDFDIDL